MLTDRPIAGTVLRYDFGEQNAMLPEMQGDHPAVAIAPKRDGASDVIYIVPLSSKLYNADNPDAVEVLGNAALQKASTTGRTFALCNLMQPLSLHRVSLDYYEEGRRMTGNHRPKYMITGKDLLLIRVAIVGLIIGRRNLPRALGGEYKSYLQELKRRQASSRSTAKLKRRKPSKDGRPFWM